MHRKITNNLHTMQPPFDKQHDFIGFHRQLTYINNVAAMARVVNPGDHCGSFRSITGEKTESQKITWKRASSIFTWRDGSRESQ